MKQKLFYLTLLIGVCFQSTVSHAAKGNKPEKIVSFRENSANYQVLRFYDEKEGTVCYLSLVTRRSLAAYESTISCMPRNGGAK